jgi:hypothetical protein
MGHTWMQNRTTWSLEHTYTTHHCFDLTKSLKSKKQTNAQMPNMNMMITVCSKFQSVQIAHVQVI